MADENLLIVAEVVRLQFIRCAGAGNVQSPLSSPFSGRSPRRHTTVTDAPACRTLRSGAVQLSRCLTCSAENTGNQLPALGDSREAFLAAVVLEEQVVGIQTHGSQNRRVQILHELRLLSRSQANRVC